MNIKLIRRGLCAAVKDARLGFRTVAPYSLDDVSSPAFMLGEVTVNYHQTFGDVAQVVNCNVDAWVLVGTGADEKSQEKLDDWLNPADDLSIMRALYADKTLGGACSQLIIRSSVTQLPVIAGKVFYGAKLSIEVWS